MPLFLSYRHWLKLASIIFPLGLIWLPSKTVSLPIGILLLSSFIFDVARLYSTRLNTKYLKMPGFSKIKERQRFSGYTFFLLALFTVMAFFPKDIAFVSIIFFVLGDIFAPFSGKISFLPKRKIIGEKTLGGFILTVTIAVVVGLLLSLVTPFYLSTNLIITAAFLTAIFDQLSFTIDDNLIVPFGTAVVLKLMNL